MRLLVCTQAVDLDDPVLGFFHRWLAELAKRCEVVHVICLKEGRHELPKNVFVHSLGKESGPSRAKYVKNFYRFATKFRREYDAVFVHMNQEYVLLGAPLWKLWGKKISMWRNHYAGTFLTNIAIAWCDVVFCTSKNSYTARSKKAKLMPIGIDTEFFSPAQSAADPHSILFLGRLDPSKRAEVFIKALELLQEQGMSFTGAIVGDPSQGNSNYAHDVRNLAAPLCLEGHLAMKPGVTNVEARDLFRSHAIYCNLSPQGMFDKTIGEAMACGCIVVSANEGVRSVVPKELVPGESPAAVAAALKNALQLPQPERQAIASAARSAIERDHSLSKLAGELLRVLEH